ncbi:MAG: DUF4990 domain-containing protein [Chitinophagales bacterium]|nr:DUF4990 domain-containing protein [Chitinophagales bacterium]
MKQFALIVLISISQLTFGRTFYMSPSGNNSNAGTISAPWLTLEYAENQLAAGDTLYLRGGTYRSSKATGIVNRFYIDNLYGTAANKIYILNYPGEKPVFNMNEQLIAGAPGDGPVGLKIENAGYLHIRGIRITSLAQNPANINSPCGMILYNVDNSIVELVEIDYIQGYGMYLQGGSDNNLIKNCDVHDCGDIYSGWGGANGFQITGGDPSNNNEFNGCRAWRISDDGFDFFGTTVFAKMVNCWSFWNGYQPGNFNFAVAGDGQGFKLGPMSTDQSGSSTVWKRLERCLAFGNRLNGFDQNSQSNTTAVIEMFNCTSAFNGSNGYFFGANTTVNQRFKNNLNFGNGIWGDEIITGPNVSNNSWNGGVTVTNADFVSIDTAGLAGPRQADGSLPLTNFMKLVSGSDLIDAGTTAVGLSYNGNSPDIGFAEFGTVAPNQAPTANAGADKTIHVPANTTSVNGSGTDPDGSIAAYQWTKVGGPATFTIATPAQATTALNALIAGTYQFELRVTDNLGATGRDTVTVVVNTPPAVNAGADQIINLPTSNTTLTGTATDPNGTISSYQWTKIAGPTSFTIATATTAQTAITGLIQGVYQFVLTATDNHGGTGKDTVTVTVNLVPNQAPVANAGANQTITLPTSTITATGSGTDPDGTIASYQWTKISGPATFTIVSPAQAQTAVQSLVQGVYQFELRVTDNLGAIGRDTMSVTVNAQANIPPVANAGADLAITLPVNTVTLNGAATDVDGSIVTFSWTKISGPATFTIASPSTAATAVNNLVQGTYVFRFTATDNNGASGTDDITVVVNPAANQLPAANAGTDRTITLPVNSLTVTGSGNDPDGNIAAYQWTKISGPATFNIATPTQAQTTMNNLVQGVYQFELRVTDNLGAIGRDSMIVTVNAAANQAPLANAGIDRSVTLPTNSLTVTGSGTDPDGSISAYQWTKITGPASYAIATAAQSQTLISGLAEGSYQFELRVTDNLGATGRDTMTVTVNAAANLLPVADAGANQAITLPASTVTLTGSGTDPDGTITGYQWSKISGPASFNIVSSAQAQTVVNTLVQGTYVFRLRVTDNSNATGDAFVTVSVNSVSNQAPAANAGPDQAITLPVNAVTVTGSGTDPDGVIATYLWTKISGPASYTIGNPSQAQTSISNLAQGTYVFSLTVTDNGGATGIDYITIVVNAGANQLPSANAGADQVITLPVNTVTLTGSGTDPDGSIVSYQWSKISGPATFSILSPAQSGTQINSLVQGTYVFRLIVTDNSGATADAFVTITVNAAPNQLPVANAGTDQTIILPVNTVSLSGSGTDPDGSISSFAWSKISGPVQYTIVSPAQAQTVVNNLVQGTYVFRLSVTDNSGATADAFVTITVNAAPNIPPVADAGSDHVLTLPVNSLTITGSGFDPDGTITAYQWNKISGPAQFIILSPSQASSLFNNLVQGTYQFELRVTDNQGALGRDTVTVIVNPGTPVNQAPLANAGADISITLPVNTVTVTGSGNDPDGTIASYQWTKINGPATFTIVNATQAQTVINNLVQGTYQFVLTVTDNSGASGKDTMTVVVNPAPAVNQAPVVNAGSDQAITLPANSVNMMGSATDPDGTISAYLWTKITGPAQYTIVFPTQAQTTINNLVEGTYTFELRATDNLGAVGRDTITITVSALTNLAPVANAGPDRSMTYPVNSINHTGGGADTDGIIVAYHWSKISGPAQYTIVTPDSSSTIFNNLEEGVYEFELRVTDNRGGIDRDTVAITVRSSGSLLKQVYPNPATTEINIRINAANSARNSLVLNIYDARGISILRKQLAISQALITETVDLTKLPAGMYIIEVRADEVKKSTMQFVKQ